MSGITVNVSESELALGTVDGEPEVVEVVGQVGGSTVGQDTSTNLNNIIDNNSAVSQDLEVPGGFRVVEAVSAGVEGPPLFQRSFIVAAATEWVQAARIRGAVATIWSLELQVGSEVAVLGISIKLSLKASDSLDSVMGIAVARLVAVVSFGTGEEGSSGSQNQSNKIHLRGISLVFVWGHNTDYKYMAMSG